jgi:hypothetical protein
MDQIKAKKAGGGGGYLEYLHFASSLISLISCDFPIETLYQHAKTATSEVQILKFIFTLKAWLVVVLVRVVECR